MIHVQTRIRTSTMATLRHYRPGANKAELATEALKTLIETAEGAKLYLAASARLYRGSPRFAAGYTPAEEPFCYRDRLGLLPRASWASRRGLLSRRGAPLEEPIIAIEPGAQTLRRALEHLADLLAEAERQELEGRGPWASA